MYNYEFEQFVQLVQNKVKGVLNCLPDSDRYQVYINEVHKNNGIVKKALQILEEGDNCSPTIYLDSYYEEYCRGIPVEEIVEEMLAFYRRNKGKMPISTQNLTSFEKMKNAIIMRLVNYERNEELLKNCPYMKWNDLAITFRWLAYSDEVGIATALITNKELEMWEVSIEQLFATAMSNTPEKFPVRCMKMEDLLKRYSNILREKGEEVLEEAQDAVQMYILSNDCGINGATAMLYPKVLSSFAKEKEEDFYILPSSVHEVILVPVTQELDKEELKKMVLEANLTVLEEGELLSNHIYYYSREKNAVAMY